MKPPPGHRHRPSGTSPESHTHARPSSSSISCSRRGSPGRPTSARVEGVFVRRTLIGTVPVPFQRIMACKCSLTGDRSACQASFGLKAASCTRPALGLLAVSRPPSLTFTKDQPLVYPPFPAYFLIKVAARTFLGSNLVGCVSCRLLVFLLQLRRVESRRHSWTVEDRETRGYACTPRCHALCSYLVTACPRSFMIEMMFGSFFPLTSLMLRL